MQNLTNYYWEDVANSFIDNVLDKLLENPDEYIIINSKGEKLLNIDKLAHDALEGIDDIYNWWKEFWFWKWIIVVISGLLGSYGGIKLIEKRTNGNTNDNKKSEKC